MPHEINKKNYRGIEQWLKVVITWLKLTNENKKDFFQVSGAEVAKRKLLKGMHMALSGGIGCDTQ